MAIKNLGTIKAIETHYKGYRFRSRLEARWAVFFDALGIEWLYEPEGCILSDGTHYLPDFYFPKYNSWVEIKPEISTEARRKCHLLAQYRVFCILITGYPVADIEDWGIDVIMPRNSVEVFGYRRFSPPPFVYDPYSDWELEHLFSSLSDFLREQYKDGKVSKFAPDWDEREETIDELIQIDTEYWINQHGGKAHPKWEFHPSWGKLMFCSSNSFLFEDMGNNGCNEAVYSAYEKAKSARFEHGESG